MRLDRLRRVACALLLPPAALAAPPGTTTLNVAEAHAAAQPALPGAAAGMAELLLEVQVNGQAQGGSALILRGRDGTLFASRADLLRWRLRVSSGVPALLHFGQPYHALRELPGIVHRLDEAAQQLAIDAPASAFAATQLSERERGAPPPVRSGNGAFFNYDLFAQRTLGRTDRAGLFEFGAFNAFGVGTLSVIADDGVRRLDSTWTRDLPEQRTSLRLGDAITRPASGWGRSLRFGGVQLATNFATQPYATTFPLPSVSGEAVLPSTVDVFVNNALVSSRPLPPGPFAIDTLPAVTGAGVVSVVVRDALGREQIVSRPFYATAALLREGLDDFSFEAGAVRTNYGLRGDQYGRTIAAGTWRRGLSDRFTAEAHLEGAEGGQATAGLAGAWQVGEFGLLNAAAAHSRSAAGDGTLVALGAERSAAAGTSFGASGQWATRDFAQLGLDPGTPAPRRLLSAFASRFVERIGSFGIGWVRQDSRDRAPVEFVSANYSTSLAGRAYVSLSLLKSLAGDRSHSVFAALSMPLGERVSAGVSVQRSVSGSRRDDEFVAQAQQGLPAGTGVGWRVRASSQQRHEAGAAFQNEFVTLNADVARVGDDSATRAGAAGGFAFIGGAVFAGRRIDDSFGVVQLPDYPGVRVFADNQPVARTDANGNAFLPRLRAYEKNAISVDAADFPLDAQIDALKIDAVPYLRSGVVLKFPVRRTTSALLRIVLDDGAPAPVGAVVRLAGGDTEFPVAHDGEAFVSGLAAAERASLHWGGQRCDIMLPVRRPDDPLPLLGPLWCHGVQR